MNSFTQINTRFETTQPPSSQSSSSGSSIKSVSQFKVDTTQLESGKAPLSGSSATQTKQQSESNALTGKSVSNGTTEQRQKYLTLNGANSSRPQPYNYAAQIKKNQPIELPIGANPFTIVQNVQDVARWTISMIETGENQYGENMKMGDRFYFQSGTCDREKSVPSCQGKTRHIVVDNIPSSTIPCSNPTIASDPKSAKAPTGLLAGVINDAVHLNPFELMASAMGDGSIVNDACVERTVNIGSMIPGVDHTLQPLEIDGVPQPMYQTVCAPKEEPLICSLESGGSQGCIKYVLSEVPETLTYNKTVQEEILTPIIATDFSITDIKQIAPQTLNENDPNWQQLVNYINANVFSFQVQKKHPSFPLPQSKNFCLVNNVKCYNNAFLYKWYANHKINSIISTDITHSFQVEWEVYQPQNGNPKVLQANLIGNSYHQWMNEPEGFHIITESFEDMEQSTMSHSPEHNATHFHTLSIIAFFIILVLLIACWVLKVLVY